MQLERVSPRASLCQCGQGSRVWCSVWKSSTFPLCLSVAGFLFGLLFSWREGKVDAGGDLESCFLVRSCRQERGEQIPAASTPRRLRAGPQVQAGEAPGCPSAHPEPRPLWARGSPVSAPQADGSGGGLSAVPLTPQQRQPRKAPQGSEWTCSCRSRRGLPRSHQLPGCPALLAE